MHGKMSSIKLLDAVTVTGAGEAAELFSSIAAKSKSFTASGTTASGTGSAVIDIEVSNDNVNWNTLGTISLALSSSSTMDGFSVENSFRFYRANVTAISGTTATVTARLAN